MNKKDDFLDSFEKAEGYLDGNIENNLRYPKMLLIKAQGYKRINQEKAIETLK
jgi:hypothetical protein